MTTLLIAVMIKYKSALSAVLFAGILTALVPSSALAQQQQPHDTMTTTLTKQQSLQSDSEEEYNKRLVTSFIEEVFNGHNMSAVDRYYAEDLIQHNPQLGKGSEGFKKFFGSFFEGFPDSHTTIEHMIAEGNLVMAFLNTTATQTGEYLGAPPTNKTIVMRSADLFRIENGMIVEHWDVVGSLNDRPYTTTSSSSSSSSFDSGRLNNTAREIPNMTADKPGPCGIDPRNLSCIPPPCEQLPPEWCY
jgi:steroid delta-isomerase-like uncharacterized protein